MSFTRHWTLGHRLPHVIASRLFGDRRRFGQTIREDDADWQAWKQLYMRFYAETQKSGVGETVNDAGYRILRHLDLDGRAVFEIGPGSLPHTGHWRGKPASFTLLENHPEMLRLAESKLHDLGVAVQSVADTPALAGLPGAFDAMLSFYSLEHLHPLGEYLDRIDHVLRPGGLLVGAIPAEGGLAWGTGRFLTTRRYIRRHSTANPDKIVCWEHPNVAESVLRALDERFDRVRLEYWPLGIPQIDVTLVVRFVYRKRSPGAPA